MTAAGYIFIGLIIGFVAGYFTYMKRNDKQEVILISGSSHELNLF